jgi:putative transcriptional regulator
VDKELFGQLVQSLKEASVIARGKAKASRSYELELPNVKQIREQTGLSQGEFAKLIRVSARTLQNWEQTRRAPTGPAAALLTIVARAPEVAIKALHEPPKTKKGSSRLVSRFAKAA